MVKKYKKESAWRRNYWEKLSPWGKFWHGVKVVIALLAVGTMFLLAVWFVLAVLGLGHLVTDVRNTILLDIMHMIFG